MNLSNSIRERKLNETLEAIKPYLEKAQITRLANLTYLDKLEMPVYTAIRPLAKALSVSQGKGISHNEAKVSAYMESIEVFFAENISPEIKSKTFSEDKNFLNPNLFNSKIIYDETIKHHWVKVSSFETNKGYYLPYQFYSIDTTDKQVCLHASDTTGLASGNSYNEALTHSLFECIERKTTQNEKIKLNIKDFENKILIKLQKTHEVFLFTFKNNEFNLPVFGCFIKNKNPLSNQVIFAGYGCHSNKQIALNRALTEAYQSKLTIISGSREDIFKNAYNDEKVDFPVIKETIDYQDIEDYSFNSTDDILNQIKISLKKANYDALIYLYHQEKLTVLKSILVKKDYLDA